MKQQNRTRNVQLILRVTQAEYDHIKKKIALMKTHTFNAKNPPKTEGETE